LSDADYVALVRYRMRRGLLARTVAVLGLSLLVVLAVFPLFGDRALPLWLVVAAGLFAVGVLSLFRAPGAVVARLRQQSPELLPAVEAGLRVGPQWVETQIGGWKSRLRRSELRRTAERYGYLWLHGAHTVAFGVPRRALGDWDALSEALTAHPQLSGPEAQMDAGTWHLRFELSEDDYVRFAMAMRPQATSFAALSLAAMSAVGTVVLIGASFRVPELAGAAFAFALFSVLFVVQGFRGWWYLKLAPWWLRRRVRLDPGLLPRGPVELAIGPEGVHQRTDLGEIRTDWSSVACWVEADGLVVLMRDAWLGLLVPTTAFGSPDELVAFQQRARAWFDASRGVTRAPMGSAGSTDPFAPPAE